MNMYKIIYPLLECRSWLPFPFLLCEEEVTPDLLRLFPLIVCVLHLIYVIGYHPDRCVSWLLEPSCYMQPCLTGTSAEWGIPLSPHPTPPSPPHPTHNSNVITLFADATIIPFTLSADATVTSWTPIKMTSITSLWKIFCLFIYHNITIEKWNTPAVLLFTSQQQTCMWLVQSVSLSASRTTEKRHDMMNVYIDLFYRCTWCIDSRR